MKYTCELCNREFNQKSHYTVHINRKFSCNPNKEINNDHEIIILNNPHKTAQNPHKTAQNRTNTRKYFLYNSL